MGQSVLLEQKHSQLHLTGVQGGYSWTCRRRSRSSILCRAQLFSSVPTFESSACPWFPGSSRRAPVRLQLATSWRKNAHRQKTITNTLFLADFRFTLNQMLRKISTFQPTEPQQWLRLSKASYSLSVMMLWSTDFCLSVLKSEILSSHVIWTYLYLREILHMFPWCQP